MRTCNEFDRYRDGELSSAERNEFEKHLAVCEDCRTKTALLNNIVYVLRQEEIKPVDQAALIAQRAFRLGSSWDALVVSWLRPGPALAALTLVLALFSYLWIMPGNQPVSASSEYMKLMDEADAILSDTNMSQVRTDRELVLWLKQEGRAQ